ncbi:MAG: RNA methyltransferase substrate-binding domain-containing protein, partial [Chitinophagales bacterium]
MKKKDILFGKNSIVEALKNGMNIDTIWISQTARDVGEIMQLAKASEVPIKKVPIQKIDYLICPFYTPHEITHQGVVA